MTSRGWTIGILLLTCAILAHAVFPRYEWRSVSDHPTALIRIDRWTGHAAWGVVQLPSGRWVALSDVGARPTSSEAIDKTIADIDKALAGKK